MDENQITDNERPVKKFKIGFNKNYYEEVAVDIEQEINNQLKKVGDVALLSKSIQQMKLELVAEDEKKRVNVDLNYDR
jgi:hypothetical protein